MNKTAINWTAYKVYASPPCEPEEVIGYYQTKSDAETARQNYIFSKSLRSDGICCNNSKYIYLEEIVILA